MMKPAMIRIHLPPHIRACSSSKERYCKRRGRPTRKADDIDATFPMLASISHPDATVQKTKGVMYM